MKTNSFYFDLPEEQIAQFPPEERGTCRLMRLDRKGKTISHHTMEDFPQLISPETLVIFNNTMVRKVRLFGENKKTGGKVEFFLLKRGDELQWECLASKSKKQKIGKEYDFPGGVSGRIILETEDNHKIVKFSQTIDDEYLNKHAHIPLPPYIKREDRSLDEDRYQTIFAEETGSSAAPTASLHFTEGILKQLETRGVEYSFVTLHVGLGTFAPVRSDNILDHKMHSEEFFISQETANTVKKALDEGRPILAVGTTSIRALESAWDGKELRTGWQSTDIFIYPGYNFKVVNQVFTNFHTPESTLLMLVSAFAGKDFVMKAYETAKQKGYMFFSYGDAMLIQ